MLFFGLAAVKGMAYVLAGAALWPWAEIGALQVGLQSAALLAVNNCRDIVGDRKAGKRTLAARFGERFARIEIAALVALPYLLGAGWVAAGRPWAAAAAAADAAARRPAGARRAGASRRAAASTSSSRRPRCCNWLFCALLAIGLVLGGAAWLTSLPGLLLRPGADAGRLGERRHRRARLTPSGCGASRRRSGSRARRCRRSTATSGSRRRGRAATCPGASAGSRCRSTRSSRRRRRSTSTWRPPRRTSGRTRCRSSTSAASASSHARACPARASWPPSPAAGTPAVSTPRVAKCAPRSRRSSRRSCTTWSRAGLHSPPSLRAVVVGGARLDPALYAARRRARLAVPAQLRPHRDVLAGGDRVAGDSLVARLHGAAARAPEHAEIRADDEQRLSSARRRC